MQKLLKIGLLFSVSLFLSLVFSMASSGMSYAISSQAQLGIGLPGLSVDVLPDTTPTPTSTPTSPPADVQSPQAMSTSQVSPEPTSAVLSKVKPASSKSSARTAVQSHPIPTPTAGGAAIPVVITIHLPNAKDLNIKIYKLFLILGVGAPLFLIGGGALYLLVKSRINQRRLALQDSSS